jgi:6-phosphofructokinase 1
VVEQAGVGGEVGSRRASDRLLVDFDQPPDRLRALAQLAAGRVRQLLEQVAGRLLVARLVAQARAHQFHQRGIPLVGVPKTIDNDIVETTNTFGFDTAVSFATDAIDRLHTTAEAHHRVMVVEVMGRYAGWIALYSGVAGGADVILIPELPFDLAKVAERIKAREALGARFSIVVVAEGAQYNGARLAQHFAEHRDRFGFDLRLTVLGYVQRGGAPTFADRMLGTRLGAAAVEQLASGKCGVLVGMSKGDITATPLEEVVASKKPLDQTLLALAGVLAK